MKKLIVSFAICLASVSAHAQSSVATAMPYECGFESDEDLSCWVMNYGTPTATDQWIVGSAEHALGSHSMYVSSDSVNPIYGNHPNIVVSYLRYKFPTSSKIERYDISFDWKGVGDSVDSKLCVMLCPESMLTTPNTPYYLNNIVSTTSGFLPSFTLNACLRLGDANEYFLYGSESWINVTLSNPISISAALSSMTFALVFIWVNNNVSNAIECSSIAIDNVQITSAILKKPSIIGGFSQCENSSMLVTWQGGAVSKFDIEYRKTGEQTWYGIHGLTDGSDGFERDGIVCSYTLQRMEEGSYDVRIRSVEYDGTEMVQSGWAYKSEILMFCPENYCIDYVNLYDTTRVICTYGHYPGAISGESPYEYIGVIDYGPDSKESRHTIHTDPNELDPRTGNKLHTVPNGAVASIRLGNWNNGHEAESITYSMTVDSINQGILIIKYAAVLEKAEHGSGDPDFIIEILDQNGEPLDGVCGHRISALSDINSAQGISNWNHFGDVAWSDWTAIGYNLMQYHGQTIKVRFTTMDCQLSMHFGYAYFTLYCANARIKTNTCGNDEKIVCLAPEGFNYAWYKGNPDTPGNEPISHDRELVIESDGQEYTCRVNFINRKNCYFDVSTVPSLRLPVPEYTIEPIYENCSSKLKFHNMSHVMTRCDGVEIHTKEPTQDIHWFFRNLSDGVTTESYGWNPVYTCPPEGDSIVVALTTYIGANNACDSTRIDTIVVPSIIPDTTIVYYTTCPGTPVIFDGRAFAFDKDTIYIAVNPNFAGCDSVSILDLTIFHDDTLRVETRITQEELPYTYNGRCIPDISYPVNTPIGVYRDTVYMIGGGEHGCDVVLVHTLFIGKSQGIETVEDENINCFQKVLYHDNLYIIRNDEWYNAEGKKVADPSK